MANLRALVRESGQMRNLVPGGADVLEVSAIDYAGAIAIGANATSMDFGKVGITTTVKGDFQVDGATTLVSASTLEGDVDLGNGDGDEITLGGAYVTLVDKVFIGTAHASGDTDVDLRVDMGVDQDKSILFDRTADSDAVLLVPDSKDAPTDLAMGCVRVNAAGAFQWYNGATWQTAGTSAGNSLQQAYVQGNTITVDTGEGNLGVEVVDELSNNGGFEVTHDGGAGTWYWEESSDGAALMDCIGSLNRFKLDGKFDVGQVTPAASNQDYTTLDIDTSSTLSLDAGAANLNLGSGGGVGAINVGIAGARTITVGSAAATEVAIVADILDLDSDGPVEIDGVTSSNFTITANNVADQTLTMAVTNAGVGDGAIDIDADSIDIDNTSGKLQIGVLAQDGAINIGTSANTGRDVTVGNQTGTSTTQIDSGTGGATINSLSSAAAAIDLNATAGGITVDAIKDSIFAITSSADADKTLTLEVDLTGATTAVGRVLLSAYGSDGLSAAKEGVIAFVDSQLFTSANWASPLKVSEYNAANEWDALYAALGNTEMTLVGALVYLKNQILAANSLQEAYTADDNTVTMTAAIGGVTWTGANDQNSHIMRFVQADAGNNPNAIEISNAGTGAAISLEGAGSRTIVSDTGAIGVTTTTSGNINLTAVDSIGITFDSAVAGGQAYTMKEGATTMVAIGSGAISLDGTDDSDFKVTGAGKTVTIEHAGGGAGQAVLTSNGTGADAVKLAATAGGFALSGTAVASTITQTATGDADDLTISVAGAHDASLLLSSAGTGTDAIGINASAGAVDIDGATGVTIDSAANGFSIDSTKGDSNITATNSTASTNLKLDLQATNTGAVAGDATLALLASSTNGSAIISAASDTITSTQQGAVTFNFDDAASGASFSIQEDGNNRLVTGGGAMSLDATVDSDFTITANAAGDQTLTLKATNAGAGDGLVLVEADGNITFDALGAASTITINQAGDTVLTGFTATSIVGALNELKAEISDVGAWTGAVDTAAGISANDLVCLDDANAAGILDLSDADAASKKFCVGVCTTGAAQGADAEVQTTGKVTVATSDAGAWSCGDAIYMATIVGEASDTAPSSSGDVVQRIGWATGSGRQIVLTIGEPTLI